jgi:hypothetical protein
MKSNSTILIESKVSERQRFSTEFVQNVIELQGIHLISRTHLFQREKKKRLTKKENGTLHTNG